MKIIKRKLTKQEIKILTEEIKKFPDIIYVNCKLWNRFNCIYIAMIKDNFAGVCAINKIKNWIKIGPFVMLEQHHGKGYGKLLLKSVIKDLSSENIFLASSNKKVKHLLSEYDLMQTTSILNLPQEILKYALTYLFQSFNFTFLKELVRKKILYKRDKFTFFLSRADS